MATSTSTAADRSVRPTLGSFTILHEREARAYIGFDISFDLSDYFFEFSLVNHLRRLLTRATEDQGSLRGMKFPGNFFESEQSGGVDSGHVSQPNDDDEREFVDFFGDRGNLVGGAEQKRPMNAEDGRVVRNLLVLKNVQAPVFDIVSGHLRNCRGLGH